MKRHLKIFITTFSLISVAVSLSFLTGMRGRRLDSPVAFEDLPKHFEEIFFLAFVVAFVVTLVEYKRNS